MPNVKIRVESVDDDSQKAQAVGQENVTASANAEKLAVASMFANYSISLGKQILSNSISQIGNTTGNYIQQDRVSEAVSFIGDMAGIGVAYATNVFAGVIATIGYATKQGLEMRNMAIQNEKDRRNYEFILERSGNSTKNGSRTGE